MRKNESLTNLFDRVSNVFGHDSFKSLFEHLDDDLKRVMNYQPYGGYNLVETDTSYSYEFQLAGASLDDIDIEIDGNEMAVRIEKLHEDRRYLKKSFELSSRSYRIFLPDDAVIDENSINARTSNGILTIEFMRQMEERKNKFNIKIK